MRPRTNRGTHLVGAGRADLDVADLIARLSAILARHSGDWASDDTALLALRVPPSPRRV
jgi:hypothetical protein